MEMGQTECPKTSTYKIRTPRNYPEENIQQALHYPIITHSYCKMQSGRSVLKYSYCIFNIYPLLSYSV